MDDNRKNAYRYLLYYFLIEIRTIPTPSQTIAHDSDALTLHSYYAGAVAYQLHNFALVCANDFRGFDEGQFWAGIQHFSINNPKININHYQKVFDDRLVELES